MDILQSQSGTSGASEINVALGMCPGALIRRRGVRRISGNLNVSTNVRQTFSFRGISETRNTSKRKSRHTNLWVGSRVTGIWHFSGIVPAFSLRYQ